MARSSILAFIESRVAPVSSIRPIITTTLPAERHKNGWLVQVLVMVVVIGLVEPYQVLSAEEAKLYQEKVWRVTA